ncbi:MAG: tetratricopeptide repeat protein [Planctomycetota bacterium]|nr:tetratricopeptide repeat protein [Planctomycetota bacterium]
MAFPIACSCGCRIDVAATDAGLTITCPDCDRRLVVPAWTELQRSVTNGEPLVAQDAEKTQHSGNAASGLKTPDSDLPDEFPFLWTPDWLCRQRINQQALQNFVAAFQKSLRQHFIEVPADCVLDVGCALLPSGKLLLDIQTRPPVLSAEQTAALQEQLMQVACPPVHHRPVVFSVRLVVGAGPRDAVHGFAPPFTQVGEGRLSGTFEQLIATWDALAAEPGELSTGVSPSVSLALAQAPDVSPRGAAEGQRRAAKRSWRDWWAWLKRQLFPTPPPPPRLTPPENPTDDQAYAFKSAEDFTVAELSDLIRRYPNYARFYRWRGEHHLRQGDFEAAIADFAELLRIRPDDLQALLTRGGASCEVGQMRQGLADFNAVLQRDPEHVVALHNRGLVYLELEAWEAAAADFGRAAEREPWEPRFRTELGKTLAMLRRYSEACEAFTHAIRLDPHDDQAYALRGIMRQYMAPGAASSVEAIADFSRAIEINSDQPLHYLRRAERYWMADEFRKAIADCDRVLQLDPDSALAAGLRGVAHESLDHSAAAIADCTTAIDADQGNFFVYLARANAYGKQGEYELAFVDADQAIGLEPDRPEGYNCRGMARAGLERFDEALEDFSQAIELNPAWPMAFGNRAVVFRLLGEPDRAIEDLDQALRLDDTHAQAYRLRAQCWSDQHELARALEDLNQAIRLAPQDPDAYLARASLSLEQHQLEQARADLDLAISHRRDFVPALFCRGQVLAALDDTPGALRDLNAVIRLAPGFGLAFACRGDIRIQQGKQEQAEADYQEAIQLDPELAETIQIQRLLAEGRFQHTHEHFDEAIRLASEALEMFENCLPAYALRASAHWYSEQYVEALADCDQVLKLSEAAVSTHSLRGQVLAELGEFDTALSELDRAVSLAEQSGPNPLLAYSLNGRALAQAGLGDLAAADRDFHASIAACPDNAWVYYNQGLVYHQQGQDDRTATCFKLALTLENPRLPPRKRDRVQAFLARRAACPT